MSARFPITLQQFSYESAPVSESTESIVGGDTIIDDMG